MLNEFDIIQNEALGTIAIWRFTLQYSMIKKKGPLLPYCFSILPLLYNRKTLNNIFNRNLGVGFFKALSDEHSMFIGLNDRIESFRELTIKSILIGSATGLLLYDENTTEIIPIRKTLPFQLKHYELSKIDKGAKRLGQWYADIGEQQIYKLLRINI